MRWAVWVEEGDPVGVTPAAGNRRQEPSAAAETSCGSTAASVVRCGGGSVCPGLMPPSVLLPPFSDTLGEGVTCIYIGYFPFSLL